MYWKVWVYVLYQIVYHVYFPSISYYTVALIFHISIAQDLPRSSDSEHAVRPTSTREQDILRKFRS